MIHVATIAGGVVMNSPKTMSTGRHASHISKMCIDTSNVKPPRDSGVLITSGSILGIGMASDMDSRCGTWRKLVGSCMRTTTSIYRQCLIFPTSSRCGHSPLYQRSLNSRGVCRDFGPLIVNRHMNLPIMIVYSCSLWIE